MPANTPDTPSSSGIGIDEAQSQILALMDAGDGRNRDEQEDSDEPTGDEAEDADVPVDEDADEEASADESEVDPEEESEEGEEAPEAPPVEVELEIDGKAVKVGLDELKKGYLRQADYTRKTQALAETRKTVEREVGEVVQERAQYAQLLTALQRQIAEAEAVAEPDWDALYAQNPIEAMKIERKWQQDKALRQQKRAAAEAEQARLDQANRRLQEQSFGQFVQSQDALLADPVEGIPEWRDEKSKRRLRAELADYCLNKLGLSSEEVRTLSDARALKAIYKSMKYDRAVERKAASQQGASAKQSPTLRPGTTPKAAPANDVEVKRMHDRLKKSGNVKDAAAILMRTLK